MECTLWVYHVYDVVPSHVNSEFSTYIIIQLCMASMLVFVKSLNELSLKLRSNLSLLMKISP